VQAGIRFSGPIRDARLSLPSWLGYISLIPVLTGLNEEQVRSCDERRCHCAKPRHGHRQHARIISTAHFGSLVSEICCGQTDRRTR